MIRKAREEDIPQGAEIYGRILETEITGRAFTGWQPGVYPTARTAREALEQDELYVMEESGSVAAAARINRAQVDVYAQCPWQYEAPAEQVMVLHTLVVDPRTAGAG